MKSDGKSPQKAQPRSLMARGIDALSRREYSRRELRDKLVRSRGEDESPEAVQAVLDELEDKKYLSDERYAMSRVRLRASRYGNSRLRYELLQQGVDEETIREAMDEAGDEFERAWAVWQKRFRHFPQDYKERAKQARFLVARGFGFDMVERVLSRALQEDEQGEDF